MTPDPYSANNNYARFLAATSIPNPLGTVRSSACAKAILVGEHAVVYGSRAVAMPLKNLKIEFHAQRAPHPGDAHVTINDSDLTEEGCEIIAQAFRILGESVRPLQISAWSNVPIGAGLGSSASLCVGILRAIVELTNQERSKSEISILANQLEERFHGTPSGLDAAVVANESVIVFRRGFAAEHVKVANVVTSSGSEYPWRFAIIDTQERASTKAMVSKAASFFSPANREKILRDFDELTELTIRGLSSGHLQDVAAAMNRCGELLDHAGIMTDKMREIVANAKEIGCPAAKSTGAGGGGCILALLDPSDAHQQLKLLKKRFSPEHVFEANL